jgi:hypothetical protein
MRTDDYYRAVLGWNCNIEIQTSRLFWNQFQENKWLVPTDDSYSCITEPDVGDRLHKSAVDTTLGVGPQFRRIRLQEYQPSTLLYIFEDLFFGANIGPLSWSQNYIHLDLYANICP